ncbi:hypothetical protein CGZ60_00190 [Neisseria animalis]|nr:hypothetical protein CGZ60_00190 [Neisseria animalis]
MLKFGFNNSAVCAVIRGCLTEIGTTCRKAGGETAERAECKAENKKGRLQNFSQTAFLRSIGV